MYPPEIRLQERLTFGQTSDQVDLWSDVPPQAETSCGQVWYYFGSGWHLVRCTPGRDILWPSVILLWVRLTFWSDLCVRLTFGQMDPQTETSYGQVWYCNGSDWHLVRPLGQVDIWSERPQTDTSCGQVQYYYGSGWHLFRSSGHVDIWSDIPPGRDTFISMYSNLLKQSKSINFILTSFCWPSC